MKALLTAFLTLGLLNVSCSHFRSSGKSEFNLRKTEKVVLSNGLEILYVHDPSLPRLHLETVLKSGAVEDPRGKEGVTTLMASLLESGTSRRSANQIAEDLGLIGAGFEQGVSMDYARFSSSSLSMNRERLLEIYVDLLLNPLFKDQEVQRLKSEQVVSIRRTQDQPSAWAKVLTDKELYQNHPYGRSARGEEISVLRLGRSDVVEQYQRLMRPENAILIVSGQISESFKSQVEIAFSGWTKADSIGLQNVVSHPVKRSQRQVVFFDKPEAQQVEVRLTQIGITRNDKRFLALRLGNMILGGSFASRLNQRVRDDLGLTYGIYSSVDARRYPGVFEISAATRHDKAAELISETLKLLREFYDKGVTEAELTAAKSVLIGQFPLSIEVVENHGFNMALLDLYGVPQTYLTEFVKNVNGVTLAQVNQAIKEVVTPDAVLITVYGRQKELEPQIAAKLKEVTSN